MLVDVWDKIYVALARIFFNWSSGLENMSQKAHYERWLMMAQEIYFMTKGVKLYKC